MSAYDCGANRTETGHVFRLDWYGGARCWCHNRPLADLLAAARMPAGQTAIPLPVVDNPVTGGALTVHVREAQS